VSLLVIDVGTSSVRSVVVRPDASIAVEHHQATLPDSPAAGLVEFDAVVMADAALDCARRALADAGPVDAVGIANQRASTIVWDAATGEPVGPGLGWQDLRTVGDCLVLQGEGLRLAPNVSATKVRHLLDQADPDRERDLRFGTVDTWIAWHLTEGAVHVTDPSNAALTGLRAGDASGWSAKALEVLRIPESVLPTVVDSSGVIAPATALDGAPPIAGLAGDQQASLMGQGCSRPGQAKITFGTGGMLDLVLGPDRPPFETRGGGGTFPIVAWGLDGAVTWGLEAIMLSAGTNVEWLRDDLGLIDDVADSHELAASCESTEGVVYVPALLGLGTPHWDYGARGGLFGLTRGTEARHVVRAVLEGVAQLAADQVESAERDAPGLTIEALRVDGGMTANPTFVQAVADATQRPVEVSPVREATALGAAFLAGLAVGTWGDLDEDQRDLVARRALRAPAHLRPRPLAGRRRAGLPLARGPVRAGLLSNPLRDRRRRPVDGAGTTTEGDVMRRWTRVLAALFAMGLLLAACGDDGGDDGGGAESAEGDGSDGGGCDADVCIESSTFVPDAVTVSAGDSVTWANLDGIQHTVTSDDGAVDSGNIDGDSDFEQTFDEAGDFAYHCEIHPSMTGTITVE